MKTPAALRAVAATLILGAGLCAPSLAGPAADEVRLRYDVSISGIRALELRYDASLAPDRYSAVVRVDFKGIASMFADFDLDIDAAGNMDKTGGLKPQSFRMVTTDEDQRRSMELKWAADGEPVATRNFTLTDTRAKQLAAAAKTGLPDPLSVLMSVAMLPQAKICAGTYRAYTGAEIVDYQFTKLGQDMFGPDSPGAYRGPAIRCRLELKPVAGVSSKRLRKWAKRPPVYTLWFAAANSPALSRNVNLIVAAEGTASGRKFKAHAKAATLAGLPLKSAPIAAQAN